MVIESMEICELPTVSRPLHFVATFSRKKPLGLVFSEVDEDSKDDDTETTASHLRLEATKDALPGEVFIKEIIPGGQADELGIFEIGDRLQGIGVPILHFHEALLPVVRVGKSTQRITPNQRSKRGRCDGNILV